MLHGGAGGGFADGLRVAEAVGVEVEERVHVLLDTARVGCDERAVHRLRDLLALDRHPVAGVGGRDPGARHGRR